jgi:probable phosphoglycerate mutase
MTTFLLVRHATNDAIGKRVVCWLPGVHLNDAGRAQAARLVDRLAGWRIDAIHSSPLERARETAAPLAAARGLDVQVDDALGEFRYGEWTGRSLDELRQIPEWRRYHAFRSSVRIPGGELLLEVQARMIDALERLRASHPEATIAIFSHAESIRVALAHYLGVPLDLSLRLVVDPASVSVVRLHEWGPEVLRMNDTGAPPEG